MDNRRSQDGFSTSSSKNKRKRLEGEKSGSVAECSGRRHGVQLRSSRRLAAIKRPEIKENASNNPKIKLPVKSAPREPSVSSSEIRASSKKVNIVGIKTRSSQELDANPNKRKENPSSHPKAKLATKRVTKICSEETMVGSSSGIKTAKINVLSYPETKPGFESEIEYVHVDLKELKAMYLWSCGICMDRKTDSEMFQSTCPHSFCLTCITAHVSAKTSDGIIKVNCPEPECKAELEPQNCRRFMAHSVVERWEMMICESVIGSEKMYCPFKDCSAVLSVEDRDRDVTSAECPYCHRLFCAQCRVPWHSGSQCSEINGEKLMDKKFVEIAQREKWQKCPSCNFYVQRSSGCESIKCRCGYKFCYVCGQNWIFGHLCPTTVNREL